MPTFLIICYFLYHHNAGGENPQGSNTLDNIGKLSISVLVTGAAKPVVCTPLQKANVTNTGLGGCDLSSLVGKEAVLLINIDGSALLYMVGFSSNV
jgi:hypothetical protein